MLIGTILQVDIQIQQISSELYGPEIQQWSCATYCMYDDALDLFDIVRHLWLHFGKKHILND